MRGRGFHIMVDDVGLGVHDGLQGLAAAAKVGDEHFDGGTGFAAVPDGPDSCREVGRSAVRQVVPRHGRHHGMAQAEGRRCLAHAGGLFGIGGEDDAAADVAEGAVAGAGVAEDEERGGLAREAFEHVRTLGAVADRVQIKPFHEGAGIGKGVAAGQLNTEPRGDPQRGFGILGCRHL